MDSKLTQQHRDMLLFYNQTFQGLCDRIADLMTCIDDLIRKTYSEYFIVVSRNLSVSFYREGSDIILDKDKFFIYSYTKELFGRDYKDENCEEIAFKALEFHIETPWLEFNPL